MGLNQTTILMAKLANVLAPTGENNEKKFFVLVYGSLRRQCMRNGILGDSKFIQMLNLPNYTLYRVNAMDYPIASYKHGAYIVTELWQIDEITKENIQNIERNYVERPVLLHWDSLTEKNAEKYKPQLEQDIFICSIWVKPKDIMERIRRQEELILQEIGPDWVKYCKDYDLFFYLPNRDRAKAGLPSYRDLAQEKLKSKSKG